MNIGRLLPGLVLVAALPCVTACGHLGGGSQLVVRQCRTAKEMLQSEKDAQEFLDKAKEPRPMVCNADGCHPV